MQWANLDELASLGHSCEQLYFPLFFVHYHVDELASANLLSRVLECQSTQHGDVKNAALKPCDVHLLQCLGGWLADYLITKKIFSVTCTWKVLKGTSMEVQVIGAQFSYKFVTSPINKRKARAVCLCMKLHVGMAQEKVYQTYKLRTAWGINLLLHLWQVWFSLFPALMNFVSLEYWIHE